MSCRRSASSTTGRHSALARRHPGCPGRSGSRAGLATGGLRAGDRRRGVPGVASSVLVPWPAAPLAPRQARTVRVRVTGEDGPVSDWSDPAVVERGLDAGSWEASLIEPSRDERGPAALFRHSFTVPRRHRVGPALRDRARYLCRGDQRPPGRRRRPGARLDQLPPSAALPGLRRDRPAAGRGERDRLHGRRRLVARQARLRPRRAGHLRDLARRARAARDHPHGRQPDGARHRRELALRDRARCGRCRPVRRRALRRDP